MGVLRQGETALRTEALSRLCQFDRARLGRKAGVDPACDAASQRPRGLAAISEDARHTGARCFVRSGAKRDGRAVAWYLIQSSDEVVGGNPQRTLGHAREGPPGRLGNDIEQECFAGSHSARRI